MSNLFGSPQNSRRAWGCLSTPSTIGGCAPGLPSPTRKAAPAPKAHGSRGVLPLWRLLAVLLGVGGWAAATKAVEARAPQQPSCAEQGPAGDWIKQAQDANRSYEQRQTAYEHALGLCPRAPALYASLAVLLLEHQDIQNGLSWARRGLEVAPGDPDLSLDLGVGLLAAGQPEEALPVLGKLAPTARNQFYLGMAYRALRDYRAAQQAFSQALAMGYPDPYLLYVLIEQDKALGDKEAGLRDFRIFNERFPDSPWLHLLLGDAYAAKNLDPQAQDEYRQALKLRPDLPIAHYQLGFIAFKHGNYPAAEQEFRQEIAVNPTFGEADLYLGATLRRMGKVSEAIPFLQQAVARDPTDPLTYNALATAQMDTNQLPAAEQTLREGARRFPQDGAFPAQLSSVLRRLGRTEEAQRQGELAQSLSRKGNPLRSMADTPAAPDLRGATAGEPASELPPHPCEQEGGAGLSPQVDPGPPPARPASGTSSSSDEALKPLRDYLERPDVECATTALNQISGPIKDSADYSDLKAQTLLLQHRKDDALAAIQKALQENPKEYRYLMTQGRIYQSFNDQEPAIRSFLLADQIQPRSADTFYFLGMSFFMMEEWDRAATHFQRALELDPNYHKAAFMMGVTDMANMHMPEAKPFLEEALKQQPNNPFYHLQYGVLLSLLGDPRSGLQEILLAKDRIPSYAPMHYHLGRLYNQTGDYEQARQELETAIRLEPDLTKAYYQLGAVYHHLGSEEKSRQAYQKFQQLNTQGKAEMLYTIDPTLPRVEP